MWAFEPGVRDQENEMAKTIATSSDPAPKTKEVQTKVVVPPIAEAGFRVRVESIQDSGLIMHKFDEKARQQMLEKQQGAVKVGKRAPRKPDEEYKACFHKLPNGKYAFPAAGFKKGCIAAANTFVDGVPKTFVRGAFFVYGTDPTARDLVEIIIKKGAQPTRRADMVRLDDGTPMERFRPEFPEWSAILSIQYNPTLIAPEHIVNLLNHAGFHVGIGDWRPEKSGAGFGRYKVAGDAT
jgi:hypothetical protein